MTRPARVWLMRHAETATPDVFHGAESDIGLSPRGAAQAAAAGGYFAPLGVTAVVSSGMRRAVDTAGPVAAACGVRHALEPGLHERRVGVLGGQPFHVTGGPWAETVRRWSAGDTDFTTPGAESYAEVRDRVVAAWDRMTAAHPGESVAVVAHGAVCKVLVLTLLGLGPGGWDGVGRVPNLAVTELHPDAGGGWRAVRLFDLPAAVAAVSGGVPTGLGPARPA